MPKITPILHVDDVDSAVKYYNTIMGFDTSFVARDENGTAFHAEVLLGYASLKISSLRHLPTEQQQGPLGVRVIVQIDLDDDIDGYYASVVQKGARILDPVAERYWGQRSFLMSDLNNYTLSVAMDLPVTD